MANTPSQTQEPEPTVPQQQGQDTPTGQMADTARPAPEPEKPRFNDWAAI